MAFHHVLLHVAKSNPNLQKIASENVHQFVNNPKFRHKKGGTPDLGRYSDSFNHLFLEVNVTLCFFYLPLSVFFKQKRFLVNMLLCNRGWDEAIASAFFDELLMRQVSWYRHPDSEAKYGGLAYLETDVVSPYRLLKSFQVCNE
jgi:hypothetical protein